MEKLCNLTKIGKHRDVIMISVPSYLWRIVLWPGKIPAQSRVSSLAFCGTFMTADGNEDEFVTYSLNDMKTIKQQFEILANAWRIGDAEKINELMVTELKTKLPKLYKKLITDRNSKWFPLIDAYMNTPQTEFILVGAGHLVGPEGILEVLKKRGYMVDKL